MTEVSEREEWSEELRRFELQRQDALDQRERDWQNENKQWANKLDEQTYERFSEAYSRRIDEFRNNRGFAYERLDIDRDHGQTLFNNGLQLRDERRKDIRLQMEIQRHFVQMSKEWAQAHREWNETHWQIFVRKFKENQIKLGQRAQVLMQKRFNKVNKLSSRVLRLLDGECEKGDWLNMRNAYRQLRPSLYTSGGKLFGERKTYSISDFHSVGISDLASFSSETPALTDIALVGWMFGRQNKKLRGLIPFQGTDAHEACTNVIVSLSDAQRAEIAALKAHRDSVQVALHEVANS